MKKIISIISFFILVLSIQPARAYYVGYGSYGMNHTKAENLLKQIPEDLTIGLGSIIFSNSYCVGDFGRYCNMANFEYKGVWNRINIGEYDILPEGCLLKNLYHELRHLQQRKQGLLSEGLNGLSELLEEDAKNYSNMIACEYY
jgi:hypothetical protein